MTLLQQMVNAINTANGRSPHQPLIAVATCDSAVGGCGNEFVMQVQDYNRALVHKHPHICPECRPRYHRRKAKANKKAAMSAMQTV
jgi:hypothetical protein